MAESAPKDKPRDSERAEREPSEAEMTRDLIEAIASTYFGACRKLAKLLNRKG